MKKILIAVAGAMLAMFLLTGTAGAQNGGEVLPIDGECPAGFELGYNPEIGEVCTEVVERDGADAGAGVTAAGTGAGTLPRTGSDSLPLAQIGAVLVAVGGLAVLATRKRAAHIS